MLLGMHSSGMAFRASKSASSQVHLVFYDVTAVFSLLLPFSVCSIVFCETPGFLCFHSFQICLVTGAQLHRGRLALMYIIMAAV
jgi:hypothetical protein